MWRCGWLRMDYNLTTVQGWQRVWTTCVMVSARSVAGLKAFIKLLDWVLTTVGLALAETKTFHMWLEWMEVPGRTGYQLRMCEDWVPTHPGGPNRHLVEHRGTTIRRIEVD